MNNKKSLHGFLALLAAIIALLVSTPFALAYFRAYGNSVGEVTPRWLLTFGSAFPSLMDFAGRIQVYQTYGRINILLIPLTLPAFLKLKVQIGTTTRLSFWAWRIFFGGLLFMSLGIFGDYCCSMNGFWVSMGFFLEMLGSLVLWVGAIIYGIASLREGGIPKWIGSLMIGITPMGIIGLVVLAHIPSGPLLGYFLFWLIFGFANLMER